MMESPGVKYRFDVIEFTPSNLQLTVGGEARALEPKLYRLLAFLIENRGQVVPKDEIVRVIWGKTAVTDNALTRAVAQIRKALDDDPKEPKYIETVPTVGYRFIGELKNDAPTPARAPLVKQPRRIGLWIGAAALVLIAGLGVWRLRSRTAEPAAITEPLPVPLTSYRGSEDVPSFSPDGNLVAFQWNGENEENTDIYVKVVGSDSPPLRLTTDPAPDTFPAWSPDGRTIAFIRRRSADSQDLILIPALGGAERKLLRFNWREATNGFDATWSADSEWLIIPIMEGDQMALFRVSVETGESSRITDPGLTMWDSWPAISPDGKSLLFTRRQSRGSGDNYVVPIDANTKPAAPPRKIPGEPFFYYGGWWTADSKDIVAYGVVGIHRMPADGSKKPTLVRWFGNNAGWIDISRTGNRIAYTLVRGDANVWRIDLTAKSPKPERLIASTFRDVYPQYSPDGKRIAFYSNRSGNPQTYISDADGRQTRQLTFSKKGSTGTPGWSPDGKTLILDSNTTGGYQLYTISVDGGKMTQLTQGPAQNYSGGWSRDGQWLYFSSNRTGRNEVWKMPSSGGRAVQVTRNGGVKAIESEDGKTLYFSKESGVGSIWKMPVAGGPETLLATSLYRFNFALARSGIYFMTAQGDDGTCVLKFYRFASGTTATILPMRRPEFGLDVSPDGRYLIYDQLDDPASDLMLVENFR